jgi:hypothetical protein
VCHDGPSDMMQAGFLRSPKNAAAKILAAAKRKS